MNVVNSIKIASSNLNSFFVKESPSILTGVGVTGLITTTIFAVKATPKALHLLDLDKDLRRGEGESTELSRRDIIKITWKCYIPTAIIGTVTIGCILGANSINLRRNAALAGLYSLTEATLKEYQEKVVEQIGKNKEQKIRDEIAQDRLNKNPVEERQVFITGAGDVLFYDSLSGRYFKSNIETIRRIQNDFNKDLFVEMYKPLNDLYSEIGLEETELGRDLGWNIDNGLLDIHFSAKIATDGVPCIVLDYKIGPKKL